MPTMNAHLIFAAQCVILTVTINQNTVFRHDHTFATVAFELKTAGTTGDIEIEVCNFTSD